MDNASTVMPETPEASPPHRWWQNPAAVWGVVLVVLIVGSVVLALTADRTVTYPEDTPEGVVQRYVAAVLDDDAETALRYYTPELAEQCRSFVGRVRPYEDVSSVDLVATKVTDDTAIVTIEITVTSNDPPFDMNRYDYREDLHLARTDDGWRIDRAGWPWFGCPEAIPEP